MTMTMKNVKYFGVIEDFFLEEERRLGRWAVNLDEVDPRWYGTDYLFTNDNRMVI